MMNKTTIGCEVAIPYMGNSILVRFPITIYKTAFGINVEIEPALYSVNDPDERPQEEPA